MACANKPEHEGGWLAVRSQPCVALAAWRVVRKLAGRKQSTSTSSTRDHARRLKRSLRQAPLNPTARPASLPPSLGPARAPRLRPYLAVQGRRRRRRGLEPPAAAAPRPGAPAPRTPAATACRPGTASSGWTGRSSAPAGGLRRRSDPPRCASLVPRGASAPSRGQSPAAEHRWAPSTPWPDCQEPNAAATPLPAGGEEDFARGGRGLGVTGVSPDTCLGARLAWAASSKANTHLWQSLLA